MRRKVYWIKGKIGGIMLEMKHICIKYNNHVVYNHAYFCAKDNELTVVVGKSGSGKSTLHELLTFQRTGTLILNIFFTKNFRTFSTLS